MSSSLGSSTPDRLSSHSASEQGTRVPSTHEPSAPRKGGQDQNDVASENGDQQGQTNSESTLMSYINNLKRQQEGLKARGLEPTRSLPLAWSHLSVRGLGGTGDVLFTPTVGSMLEGPFAAIRDRRRGKKLASAKENHRSDDTLSEGAPAKPSGLGKGERYLLHDFSGVVKPGEMLLVVGRPGSGCTTFLKTISGLTQGFAGVDGDVYYGSIQSKKELRPYAGQVVFNSEDDIHFPNLQVGRTLDFALRNNVPAARSRPAGDDGSIPSSKTYEHEAKENLLKIFGLTHTSDTKVGDAYVRGVSGGERKRVSIAEVLTNRATVQAWDNATRGLDANTALEYTKIMRVLSDVELNTTLVSLYQAGNQIYDQFDKVLVIAQGQILYYGPRCEAQGYMEDLGFEIIDGANVADFLTGVTVPKERQIRQGFENKVPQSINEFSRRYRASAVAKKMQAEVDAFLKDQQEVSAETDRTKAVVQLEKHEHAIKREPQTTGFGLQIRTALVREYQQRWGDQWTLWARQATTLVQAFIIGSIFYMIPLTTGGIFTRGGCLFLSLLFPSLISLSETTAAFEGRAVLAKHKAFSLYRPSAVVLAQTIADLPIFFVQLTIFTLIVFFMSGLKQTASTYFIFLLIVFTTTVSTTALFRFIGASFGTFQNASKVSGFTFSVLVTYAGYIIPTPSMRPWFGWLRWLDPVYYGFEALMGIEFSGQTFACAPNQLVPYGTGYTDPAYQGCAIAGAAPGATTVDGDAYLAITLELYRSHLWRNFGIIVAIWLFFVGMTMWATERLPAAGSTKAYLFYKRGGGGQFIENAKPPRDEEEGHDVNTQGGQHEKRDKEGQDSGVESADSVFTWKKLTYTVQVGGKPLALLQDVQGYCKPGTLTALMGASGAGKTTLLDVLAQRKDDGTITGEVLVNGQELPVSFQRTTGYCEQLDVHLPQATVREALEFSALLRQPRTVSRQDKLAYVDTIISLLELEDIEDAIIGQPGAGLGIEQRKRLTIGVELVSKPTLLFLDEPTSGLDGQSSFLIVSFLRKLAAAGQAVLCTIHQPSASLFAEFDYLLLLKQGGKTVYFGEIEGLSAYFKKENAEIPKKVNPAEFMIDVVSGELSKGRDWAEVWLASDNHAAVVKELEELKAAHREKRSGRGDDEHEFASTTVDQFRLVLHRASVQLWRNTDYVKNKVALHIGSAIFNGFSFWMIGNKYADLQNRLFTIFQFVFVAPGVIAQTQPKFIANRDIFEAREKKAKLYSWQAFVFGEIVAEVPYLLVCAFLYFAPWYALVGLSYAPSVAGPVYLQMTLYEFLYTGIGQFVAAYAPNAVFAALVNPLLIGVLVTFSGVLTPYRQITAFWRYWLYYLDPFNYLMGGMLVFPIWDVQVECAQQELGRFSPPPGQTCGAYMAPFFSMNPGYLEDPTSTVECAYCIYSKGSEYLASLNLPKHSDGWRDIGITAVFVMSSYMMVFVLMKLRSKKTKSAKTE